MVYMVFFFHEIDSVFARRSLFWTPPGFATTNYPAETFNTTIRQGYTFNSVIKLFNHIDKIKNGCVDIVELKNSRWK
ncbi:hypothetical protein PHMEG_00019685 [Phytophthora megakarya]|uniref:Uncharacterized protein n=1 Tax=Phytophthora megakarya TaxID=4795 RepID=A0A225VQN6_9STRA|nr:hypothetical protein PHMEG_00019685 [Phytophthora megakarya]